MICFVGISSHEMCPFPFPCMNWACPNSPGYSTLSYAFMSVESTVKCFIAVSKNVILLILILFYSLCQTVLKTTFLKLTIVFPREMFCNTHRQ